MAMPIRPHTARHFKRTRTSSTSTNVIDRSGAVEHQTIRGQMDEITASSAFEMFGLEITNACLWLCNNDTADLAVGDYLTFNAVDPPRYIIRAGPLVRSHGVIDHSVWLMEKTYA